MPSQRRTIFITFFFLAAISALLIYAPHFLIYSDRPEKSDAVVMFLGKDQKARLAEANWLLAEGYADYILIPGLGIIQKISQLSGLPVIKTKKKKSVIAGRKKNTCFEGTHVEVIEARRMMSRHGLTSAIFVSSPYHMRRVKVITEKVFDGESSRIVFAPTRFEKVNTDLRRLKISDWKYLGYEYLKMAWFMAYSMFMTDQDI
ncbi:MAG: ElyC/SanA/YdcF family protein [Desulfobacterales bacterium]